MQLWRVIKNGYSLSDPDNLTSSEIIDEQLNASAMHMLEKSMANEGVDHIRSIKTAKEAWDYIVDLYDGNTSMQRSKKAILQQQVDDFIMKDGESRKNSTRDSNLLPLP
jgi:alpha-galactosidase